MEAYSEAFTSHYRKATRPRFLHAYGGYSLCCDLIGNLWFEPKQQDPLMGGPPLPECQFAKILVEREESSFECFSQMENNIVAHRRRLFRNPIHVVADCPKCNYRCPREILVSEELHAMA